MFASERTETIGFKQCHSCQVELLERDNFCRRCGVSQSRHVVPSTGIGSDGGVAAGNTDYRTRPLSGGEAQYRAFSGPMIGVVTQGLSERTSSLRANRWTMRLVGALVAAPLWLMIVLLSPLDAYIAAKAIAKQV